MRRPDKQDSLTDKKPPKLIGPAVRDIREALVSPEKELAWRHHVEPKTLREALSPFRDAGLIERRTLNRTAYWLLAPEAGVLLGVDLAPTGGQVVATRCNFDRFAGRSLDPFQQDASSRSATKVLDEVAKKIFELIDDANVDFDEIVGVGIAVPAPVDRESGRPVAHFILPGWESRAIAREIEQRLEGIPVMVGNDASLGALGFFVRARMQDPVGTPGDLLYIRLVGDGIGAGLIQNGRLVTGGTGFAGELGHVKIADDGPLCTRCGGIGCLESLASAETVRQDIAAAVRKPDASLEDLLKAPHPAVKQALHRAGWRLGSALAHAVTLTNPEWIILDGKLANEEVFSDAVVHALERSALPSSRMAASVRAYDQVKANWNGASLWNARAELTPVLLGSLAYVVDQRADAFLDARLKSMGSAVRS